MIGQTILHYKILEKLGEGGMGEVFKARDTKLDRFVALKFLPSQLIASEDDKARFIQEAKAASAMNHPNVCTIHDIQEHNGQLFIVMEFIDGVTLRDNKQNLSGKRILDIAIQVAEGLGAAHEKGIVHRDIKPENIMIRKDGIVQIMDFGLAKLYSSENVSRLTKAGTTMGTMGYMSPEQVQGMDVDFRTDIFSFGVVLYEMIAGEAPFKGMHQTAIMYEIVNVSPAPPSTLKEGIDPQLDAIILECLEKEREERFQSAKELAKNLRRIRSATGQKTSRIYNVKSQNLTAGTAEQKVSKSSGSIMIEAFDRKFELQNIFKLNYIQWTLILLLLLLVVYLLVNKSPEQNLITATSSILPPKGVNYVSFDGGDFELSPDGKTIAFVGVDSLNVSRLWVRPINSLQAKEFPGTENAIYPFWSPDGKYIAFFKSNSLMKIDANGGSPIKICDAPNGRGGTWNKNNKIVFAPNSTGGLYLISANGGNPDEIVKQDKTIKDQSLRFPFFLPDGKHFIYSVQNLFSGPSPDDMVKIGSINSDVNVSLFSGSTNAEYSDGKIFYLRQATLMCQGFDTDNFKLKDDIQSVSPNIYYFAPRIKGAFSVSQSGNLVYQSNNQIINKIGFVDRNGISKEILFQKSIYNSTRISPDNTKIAFDELDSEGKNSTIWQYDILRKIMSRVSYNPNFRYSPVWSPDSKKIVFFDNRNKFGDIYIKNADGTGDDTLLYKSDYRKIPADWSSDGNYLLFDIDNVGTKFDIDVLNLKNKSVNVLLNSNFNEHCIGLSKDMKWILYTSDESGSAQAYVRPFSNGTGRWQITTNGVLWAGWDNSGRSIYYLSGDYNLSEVGVNISGQSLNPGLPHYLFNIAEQGISRVFDITKDNKYFLVEFTSTQQTLPPLTYIQNWQGLINEGKK
jgi:serine/threonine protein kinase